METRWVPFVGFTEERPTTGLAPTFVPIPTLRRGLRPTPRLLRVARRPHSLNSFYVSTLSVSLDFAQCDSVGLLLQE